VIAAVNDRPSTALSCDVGGPEVLLREPPPDNDPAGPTLMFAGWLRLGTR
jgi:hypothetical protein